MFDVKCQQNIMYTDCIKGCRFAHSHGKVRGNDFVFISMRVVTLQLSLSSSLYPQHIVYMHN